MSIIQQNIMSKKLLLVYCIENIRLRFNKVDREIDFKSPEEKFDEIMNGNITSFYFPEHMKVTINNIEYLLEQDLIDANFLEQIQKEIECYLQRCEEYKSELQDVCSNGKNEYINRTINIENFLNKLKTIFMYIIDIYERYMYCERGLIDEIIHIWNKELTNCDKYTDGNNYKFLVYTTKNNADSVIESVLRKNAVIHTSYITNEHTMTYQDRDYGLIYGLNSENLLFMSDSDNMAVDEEICLDNFKFSLDKYFFFRGNNIAGVSQLEHNIARTYLPDQLLGENYNEIDLANNEYTIPRAVFVFEDAKEFGRKESKKLAEKLKLKLLILQRKPVPVCRK